MTIDINLQYRRYCRFFSSCAKKSVFQAIPFIYFSTSNRTHCHTIDDSRTLLLVDLFSILQFYRLGNTTLALKIEGRAISNEKVGHVQCSMYRVYSNEQQQKNRKGKTKKPRQTHTLHTLSNFICACTRQWRKRSGSRGTNRQKGRRYIYFNEPL